MTISRYGYYNTGNSPDFGTLAADKQRAYVPDPLTQTVIFYELAAKIGRNTGTTPTTRFGIANTTNGVATGSPDDRISYTGPISPSTAMVDSVSGAVYTGNITPFIGTPGEAYALVLTSTNAILGHGMIQKASLPGKDNYNFYDKTNASSIPTDPVGGTPATNGHIALWANAEINVAPNTPTGITPSGTVSSGDLTPTIGSNFSDPNETLPNGAAFDYVNRVYIQVRRKSDAVMFWDTNYAATSSEQSSGVTAKAYAGTVLVPGTTYQVRIKHSDRAGAQSLWSGWTDFTVAGGGSVTGAGGVAGKQNSTTPGPFTAVWNHPTPLNATAAIIRIEDDAGNVLQTMSQGSPKVVSVANGGTISLTWADTGFTALARTTDVNNPYRWRMQAKDSAGVWSDWSGSRSFTVNATPGTPRRVAPPAGGTVTALPIIKMRVTDIDDAMNALTLTLELKRADTTTVTRTMTFANYIYASDGVTITDADYTYQTTATDVPSFQTMQYRAKASDGTSESPYNAYNSFAYVSGPVVTITAPTAAQVLTKATTRITWTVPSGGPQVKYRVEIDEINPATGDIIVGAIRYDTGDVVSTNLFHDVATGFFRNGKNYQLTVTVTNATPLSGASTQLFSISYTPPATVNGFSVIPFALHAATDTDANRLEWDASLEPVDSFRGYDIYRTALGSAPGTTGIVTADVEELGQRKWLQRLPNPAQTTFVDANVQSGVAYQYELVQTVKVGSDELSSVAATANASVQIPHVVLSSALNPETYGVELRFKAGKGAYMNSELTLGKQKVFPINAKRGRTISSNIFAWSDTLAFDLISTPLMTADERFRRLSELLEFGGTLCLRTFTGTKRYVSLDGGGVNHYTQNRYSVSLKLSEEQFTEGLTAGGS